MTRKTQKRSGAKACGRHRCDNAPAHPPGSGNSREAARTQGTGCLTGPEPGQPAGLQGRPCRNPSGNTPEIKNANIPGILLQRNKNTRKFKEAYGASVKSWKPGGFPSTGSILVLCTSNVVDISTEQLREGTEWIPRSEAAGDQNPCLMSPCFKSSDSPQCVMYIELYRMLYKHWEKRRGAHWNFTGC